MVRFSLRLTLREKASDVFEAEPPPVGTVPQDMTDFIYGTLSFCPYLHSLGALADTVSRPSNVVVTPYAQRT